MSYSSSVYGEQPPCFGGALSLIQGPPGCGKTHFLVTLMYALLRNARLKVMVCAPSNRAVRVALEAFLNFPSPSKNEVGDSDQGVDDVDTESRLMLELWHRTVLIGVEDGEEEVLEWEEKRER